MVEPHLLSKHVVLVDDDPALREMVGAIFAQQGFRTVTAFAAPTDALAYCREARSRGEEVHLLVLDVMMPLMNGLDLLERIRLVPGMEKVPAVFLTARDEPYDRIQGLGLGADDYIAKPFLPQELMLRVLAVLRRCYAQESPELDLGFCTVSLDTAEVTRPDGVVALTAKERAILATLAQNRGRIVTIDSLSLACWGDSFGYENSLMAHVRRLREKIERDPSAPEALVTVRGLGYKLTLR
ncbi:response regulator transcription factor [Eggerthellaceae bacterium zg-1084]|uniref:Response regulator transcription factor n=1 Tax=Berryella wangjianweii TaxID=2734634 RepID=A0A6M8IYH0_9ACTN|nr:response regulator transcription factor [Berryella wangjianweii]NPD32339.1 response regulator transcription factor [Eggerthellaceae bacterium zg-997]QKF07965.1 response regulator transcription factor [Berryella wangjianweii]